MIIRIDPDSPIPPYEQIRTQVSTMVATGVLPAGTRLPPIRQLSKDLGLAGGTVARAYRELEAEGVITTRGRHGTHVNETNGRVQRGSSAKVLEEAAMTFAVQARQLGADSTSALNAARDALESVEPATER